MHQFFKWVLVVVGVVTWVISQSPLIAQPWVYRMYRPRTERLILVPWILKFPTTPPKPQDKTPPKITALDPSSFPDSFETPINVSISVTFDESMQTVQSSNLKVYLNDPHSPLAGTVSMGSVGNLTNNKLIFTPSSLLEAGKNYTVSMSGMKDLAGNPAQAGSWQFSTVLPWRLQWGAAGGGTCGMDGGCHTGGRAVTVDLEGNIYVAGVTNGTITNTFFYQKMIPSDPTLSASLDTFIVKYDPTGYKLWVRQIGTVYRAEPMGIAVGPSKDLYVMGRTTGIPSCGQTSSESHTTEGNRLFLAKIDATSGECKWLKITDFMAGHPAQLPGSLAIDSKGDIYLLGSDAAFNGLSPISNSNLWVWKYSSDGTLVWSKSFGKPSSGYVAGDIAKFTDPSGTDWIFIVGGRYNPVAGSTNPVVIKIGSDGTQSWEAERSTPVDWDMAQSVVVDETGSPFVTGSKALFSGNEFQKFTTFLLRYDSSGGVSYGTLVHLSGKEASEEIFPLRLGLHPDQSSLYLSGTLNDDYFLAQYTAGGGAQTWDKGYSSLGAETIYDMTIDGNGNIYMTGSTTGDLDGGAAPGHMWGVEDAFLVSYDADGNSLTFPFPPPE